jgi:hypothetical protein
MKMRLSIVRCGVATLAAGLFAAPIARSGQQQPGSSLTDSDVENRELKIALNAVLAENQQLREALVVAETTLVEMRKAVAANTGETEVFRRQALELKKRFEALGPDAAGNERKLEQRLLAAVSDLQQAETEKKRLTEAMIRLSEAVLHFSKTATSSDAEARLTLEAEVRNANKALGVGSSDAVEAAPVAATLTDASVISVRDELSLVVVNLGRAQGVKVGMPFQVSRGSTPIGAVRVVEVREKFAGAVIQHLNSETNRVKVGDRLKVDTQP